MVPCWMLSEAIRSYCRYTETQRELRDALSWELKTIVSRENRRFEDAQRNTRALIWFWKTLRPRLN